MSMVGEAFIRVRPNTTTFGPETKAGVAMALRGVGAGGAAAGLGLTAVGVGAVAATLLMAKATGQAATLEQTLDVFEATAEATAAQMVQVSRRARELGADLDLPATSAVDAAQAMTQLAKGGLSIVDTLGGARGVLQLAAAAELEVAEAADITANALNAFQLPGTEAAHVADLLAGASIAASGDITQMAQALQQSAAVAAQAGIPLADLTAMITALAKRGIQGSDAGTSIRTTLLRLIPTSQEAADVVEALGISVSDAEGNFLDAFDIFEQYREKLALLTPVQRQAALATIFGTDAIRAATVFANEGARGLEDLRDKVDKQGTAARLAAARTKGLKGQFSGLISQGETLGATVGGIVVPALTGLVTITAKTVGALNKIAEGFIGVTDAIGGAIGAGAFEFFDRIAQPIGTKIGEQLFDASHALQELLGNGEDFANMVAGGPTKQTLVPAASVVKDQLKKARKLVGDEGAKTGAEYDKQVARGIVRDARLAVTSAKRMLADVIEAGNQAIEDAAFGAKQNLTSLGDDLATMASQIIDNGPLGRQIKRLQEQLSFSQNRGQRQKLTRDLRDANEELARARKQVATAAGRTPAQQKAVDEFLRPFVEKVQDAKAAVGEFNTEGILETLQKTAEKQKETVVRGIGEVIAAFNAGRIDADEANRGIARTLAGAQKAYGVAGAKLGLAFRLDFVAQLAGIKQQINEIISGPSTSRSGLEPDVISPSDVAAEAGRNTADAQLGVVAAQRDLRDTVRAQLREDEVSNDLLKQIRDAVTGRQAPLNPKHPSSDVPFNPARRGGR